MYRNVPSLVTYSCNIASNSGRVSVLLLPIKRALHVINCILYNIHSHTHMRLRPTPQAMPFQSCQFLMIIFFNAYLFYLYMTMSCCVRQLNSPSSICEVWKPQLQFLLMILASVSLISPSKCCAILCEEKYTGQ